MQSGNRNDFEKYTTEYQRYIINRFSETISCEENNCAMHGKFICVLEAPEPYEVETEMLTFGMNHQNATLDDFLEYFMEIVPPGLPPCASEWEDDED